MEYLACIEPLRRTHLSAAMANLVIYVISVHELTFVLYCIIVLKQLKCNDILKNMSTFLLWLIYRSDLQSILWWKRCGNMQSCAFCWLELSIFCYCLPHKDQNTFQKWTCFL